MKDNAQNNNLIELITNIKNIWLEGYKQCESDYQSEWNHKDANLAWELSHCKEKLDELITYLQVNSSD